MQTVPVLVGGCGDDADGPAGLRLRKITDAASLAAVRAAVRDLSRDDATRPRFPGPNPVSLDTGHFARLKAEPYYVCEKTDGVRHAMVCFEAPDPTTGLGRGTVNMCALVDRALTAYLLPLGGLPKAMFQGSLLDGELAWNAADERWEYLVFDAVCVSGVPVLEGDLVRRLEAVRCALRVYREVAGDPVSVRAKPFFSATRFEEFEEYLAVARTRYAVDGLILTPALPPAVYGRHAGMFKVKFDSKHTVDFLVAEDGRGLRVFEAGTHVTVGALHPSTASVAPGSVAECALHGGAAGAAAGQWGMVMIRRDKTTANDMFTYQKTMLNIREGLGADHVKALFAV